MIDVNIRGVLHGISAALPGDADQGQRAHRQHRLHRRPRGGTDGSGVLRHQVRGAGRFRRGCARSIPATSGSLSSPGGHRSELAESIFNEQARDAMREYRALAIPPSAIADAIAFAIGQPLEVDVNEIIVRPAASTH